MRSRVVRSLRSTVRAQIGSFLRSIKKIQTCRAFFWIKLTLLEPISVISIFTFLTRITLSIRAGDLNRLFWSLELLENTVCGQNKDKREKDYNNHYKEDRGYIVFGGFLLSCDYLGCNLLCFYNNYVLFSKLLRLLIFVRVFLLISRQFFWSKNWLIIFITFLAWSRFCGICIIIFDWFFSWFRFLIFDDILFLSCCFEDIFDFDPRILDCLLLSLELFD